ncbi:hypothetical protein BOTBODRAFT_62574 [Botryobasidium botryosum FD-172 SS1]|uniref:Mur ligase central domain-containing protein n=1 Tax=Botryobasidium botryosum (strain FD-172 SS1) TaxID=930990 RepID=A0A067MWZ3_BOTB1|nr:hypothetical protein BOTBODRAFT_62574 [Botryobasidium botryosum FD-172 SS1]
MTSSETTKQTKIDLSLDRIRTLQAHLPPYTRPTIHIAGTNGKGSTVALLASIFQQAGFRTGTFNSPHLLSPRDSIKLSGEPISEGELLRISESVSTVDTLHGTNVSNFELLTATALAALEEAQVDVAIVEVGMGGRRDSTNILPTPCILASAITNIALDHQEYLGNTIADIAREKAGIVRFGRVVVVGEQSGDEVFGVVREIAASVGAGVVLSPAVIERPWDEATDGPLPPPFSLDPFRPPTPQSVETDLPLSKTSIKFLLSLQGAHQRENAAVALALIDVLRTHPACHFPNIGRQITDEHIRAGLREAKWPGRLEWIHVPITAANPGFTHLLVDGAHNAASAHTLRSYISSLPLPQSAPTTFILALSHSASKTPASVLTPLLREGDRVALVRFSPVAGMPWVHPVDPVEMKETVRSLVGDLEGVVEVIPGGTLAGGLEWAERTTPKGGLVVLAGSLYLVADLYRWLDRAS